jgi:hypothetical protein
MPADPTIAREAVGTLTLGLTFFSFISTAFDNELRDRKYTLCKVVCAC